ncbi:MAG TPA: hypothetical protein PK843_07720 [bacterium]|nr:hypothetical protein [bacterium]HPN34384.1 hypothetical protein [bacterium]
MKKCRWLVIVLLPFASGCSLFPAKKINVEIRFVAQTTLEDVEQKPYIDPVTHDTLFVFNRVEISNYDIKSAQAIIYRKYPALVLELTEQGALKWSQLTRVNRRQRLVILFNKKFIGAPIITRQVLTGKILIEGNFTQTQTKKWAKGINRALAAD